MTYLYKDGEVDDNEGGGDVEVAVGEQLFLEQHGEGECDGPAQPPVRHDELVHLAEGVDANQVGEVREDEDTCRQHDLGDIYLVVYLTLVYILLIYLINDILCINQYHCLKVVFPDSCISSKCSLPQFQESCGPKPKSLTITLLLNIYKIIIK